MKEEREIVVVVVVMVVAITHPKTKSATCDQPLVGDVQHSVMYCVTPGLDWWNVDNTVQSSGLA